MMLTAIKPSASKSTLAQVETLAKLYLEGDTAEISDDTISHLCDWLMGEFQQLPLNLQFSDYPRYATVQEMFMALVLGGFIAAQMVHL